MKEEEIDIMSYVYKPGQKVEIEGNIMLLMARFLGEVATKETTPFASFVYPEKVHETKDKDGNTIKVDFEWKEHTKDSFMMTAVEDNNAQLGLTAIGVKASQILSGILHMHQENINAGIAKTETSLNEERAFKS